jgi:phosphoribosylformylglycinamidine synthase II
MDAWCIEVAIRPPLEDPEAPRLEERVRSLGLELAGPPLILRGYVLPASLEREAAERAAANLLADPVSDRFQIAHSAASAEDCAALWPGFGSATRLTVRRRPGVMDPVVRSVLEGLRELDIPAETAGTYRSYVLPLRGPGGGQVEHAQLEQLGRSLHNEVIEELVLGALPPGLPQPGGSSGEGRVEIPLAGLSEEQLVQISKERCFSLNGIEMREIQAHFDGLGRAPTLTELETLAQTWSEHCKHKTLTGRVEMEGGRSYDNLLKETIFQTTVDIDHPFCVSVFVDNAGVVQFHEDDCLCIKVETHNHPSAIEPFGGAGTGVGGVIRDVMGTGLGARPLCNLDVFCVAPPDMPRSDVPSGCLHPARVLDGVIAGVRDYGNPMGIPTVTGAVHVHDDFVGNPLVYCGTVGILPRDKVAKGAKPGDRILVAGGRTGRDGIHGATFSSIELTDESEMVSSGAVQIGDPIQEKIVLDAQLEARDLGLYDAVTDCGAGGFSSAVGEMGEEIGARVHLENAPLKYSGLTPTEIWISEAQERMVYAVPADKVAAFREVFDRHEVETAELGEFTDTGRLEIYFKDELLCDVAMEFLHDGVPRPTRKARWTPPTLTPAKYGDAENESMLLEVLSDWAVCSKEWITRQYDHEVQGYSAAKPFAGPQQRGPGDASVLAPKPGSNVGFAVATGLTPRYSLLDPASMAEAALDEALRNVVVRGGDPGHCAVLDNYCWGSCDDPEQLGRLVRATEAICALALHYRTPFVSGKDSLNNEFRVGERLISIPGCLLVSALAIVPDLDYVPDSAFVNQGSALYLLGTTRQELGGSAYLAAQDQLGEHPPRIHDAAEAIAAYRALHESIRDGQVAAAHDLAEGGLAVALSEMAIGAGFGAGVELTELTVQGDVDDVARLFGESLGRILIEAAPGREQELEELMRSRNVPFARIGSTAADDRIVVDGLEGSRVLDIAIADVHAAWQAPLSKGPLACIPGAQ